MSPFGLLIWPEAVLLLAALIALFADTLFPGHDRAGAWVGFAGASLAGALALVSGRGTISLFGGQYGVDGIGMFARIATCVLAAAFLLWLAGSGLRRGSVRVFVSLALFSTLGCLLMVAARDWIVLLLALETATMPAYVLIGFDRADDRSLEGAMKYFLLSMVASLLFMYGVSFVVGMSGTTLMDRTIVAPGAVGLVAAVFVSAGLLAKLSAAPFQWWSPDAYAGAPAASVAFVSSVPKIAGLVAFARVIAVFGPPAAGEAWRAPGLAVVVLGAAALSMLIGNLAAYPQQDMRRLMAYSGIAHAGYLLLGLATGGVTGVRAAVFYAAAYAVPSLGVMLVSAEEGSRIDDLRGLVRRRPWVAWTLVVFLLSLIGVPPLAGFSGKLLLFGSALDAGLLALVVLALVMSVVSAGFYFRIVRAVFFAEPVVGPKGRASGGAAGIALVVLVSVTLAMGVAASPLLGMVGLTLP